MRSYVIVSGGRAGTTFLAEALASTGRLGDPKEYFIAEDRPMWSRRWGLGRAADAEAFMAAARRARVTPNGVYGARITTGSAEEFMALGPGRRGAELMDQLLAESLVIHVRRRDKVAATFSQWRAECTGQWVRFEHEPTDRAPLPAPDDRWVADHHAYLHRSDSFWSDTLRRTAGATMDLSCGDIVADPAGTVARVGLAVEVADAAIPPGKRLPVPASDPRIDAMEAAWRSRTGGCAECSCAP